MQINNKKILIMNDWDAHPESRCCYCVLSTGLFSLCLYPWMIQGLPNLISIFLSFLDVDVHAPGCIESTNSVIVRVFTTDTICTDWILLLQSQRCAMQSTSLNTTMQLLYKFHGRTDDWKCVYVTFDLFIVFWHFSVNIWYSDFVFWRKPSKKYYLSFYQSHFFEF